MTLSVQIPGVEEFRKYIQEQLDLNPDEVIGENELNTQTSGASLALEENERGVTFVLWSAYGDHGSPSFLVSTAQTLEQVNPNNLLKLVKG